MIFLGETKREAAKMNAEIKGAVAFEPLILSLSPKLDR
jgi:hypothetical protein